MDILIEKLNNEEQTSKTNYNDLILDLHRSSGTMRGKYINYIVHGINKGILKIDKLFHKSVISCSSIEQCFSVGIFLRMGARVDRFYNGKNIAIHIVDRYHNYNEEIYIFLMTMLLLKGLSYNDFQNQNSPNTVGDYFKTKGIQIFFPKNIRLENQRLLNLFMDKQLDEREYKYTTKEIIENLSVKLIQDKIVITEENFGEDDLVMKIIDSGSMNLFVTAFESSYKISYFNIMRICVELKKAYESRDTVLTEQYKEMLIFLDKKKIYVDEYQYSYIKYVNVKLHCECSESKNSQIKELLKLHMKQNEDSMHTLNKLKFTPSYIHEISGLYLENIKYKALSYRIEKNGIDKVMNRI